MWKKDLYADDARARLEAGARDRLSLFILDGANARGGLVHGTRMVREMRANHGLGPLETLVLGQAYLAAGLIASQLKGADRLRLKVECSGPIRGLSVEAGASGEVRGYLPDQPFVVPDEVSDLASLWGEGVLSVTKYLENGRQPFSGQVPLVEGRMAINLARYFLISDQTATAFNLSIKFDDEGNVEGAGGVFLQALPGASDEVMSELEDRITNMPSPGAAFAGGREASDLLDESFGAFFPRILESRRVEFFCGCSPERFEAFLGALPIDDLRDLATNGPFPLRTTCHNCNSTYEFAQDRLRRLVRARGVR